MEKVFSVTQVNTYVKQIFDVEEFLINIKISGEVSGFKISNGIAYFNLKDENSILNCICFNRESFISLQDGDSIIVTGSFNYYVKGGRLSFNVIKAEKSGTGDLFNNFLKLKQKLEEEGIFNQSLKKQLPKNIKTIGVVTSETGAVIQDIINVSTRRNPNINIVLFPVKVQGNNAEFEICHGIRFFDAYDKVDVIIVARGGGSLEDLAPFNTEIIARTIFDCNKVVISAVGHETDYTICDFASDLRAPTPSAAAELVTTDQSYKKSSFLNLVNKLNNLSLNFYKNYKTEFKLNYSKLDYFINNYLNDSINRLIINKNKVNFLLNDFLSKIDFGTALIKNKLENLNPKKILGLGYAIVQNEHGEIVNSIELLKNKLTISVKDGTKTVFVREEVKDGTNI